MHHSMNCCTITYAQPHHYCFTSFLIKSLSALISLQRALPSGNASSLNYRLVLLLRSPILASIPQVLTRHTCAWSLSRIRQVSFASRPGLVIKLYCLQDFAPKLYCLQVLRSSRVNVSFTSLLITQEFRLDCPWSGPWPSQTWVRTGPTGRSEGPGQRLLAQTSVKGSRSSYLLDRTWTKPGPHLQFTL